MKIGFIGLGRMGGGMAANIVQSGQDVTVFDVFEPAMLPFADQGVAVAGSIGELAAGSDVIFTSLPGPVQVEDAVRGVGGILENAREGTVFFDLSSNSRETVTRLHKQLAGRGISMLDAPVSGGPAGAASGNLVLWAGGDKEAFELHESVLQSFASAPRYVGAIGAGTVTKLSHNLLGNMIFASIAEVFTLAVKAGLDPLDLWEALQFGVVGKARPLDHAVKQFLPNQYEPPSMQLKLGHKDVGLAVRMGKELGVPMRLANLVHEEISEAVGRGFGDLDSRSFMKLQVERSGVDIAVDPERLRAAVDQATRYHQGQ
ncbi:NAD(P)-dependent oxidoreductase [Arthrobacter bambusae]|uniref:NAD(P)-dependent oxidoreductase n=1 Tax=Arthrobacter bambusae TaxID=1338426 RepID=UPI001F508E95|nr:NAD(P)-dependent oxidoreductase [Arthrobacter bambusae]MCI0142605.1 NAD(P)-dependent oxidoreductase [Arthrobacter bambusae]